MTVQGTGAARRRKVKSRANGRSTYQGFLDASLELWGREGIQSVTMSAVAALAGKTRRTAYHHFPDRQALIDATVRYLDDTLAQLFREAADEDEHPYLVVTKYAADLPHLVRPYLADVLDRDPNTDRVIQVAIQHFQNFQAKGRLQEGVDPAYVAMIAVSLWFAAMLSVGLGRTLPERQDHALRFARTMQHMMFNGLIKPETVPPQLLPKRSAKPRKGQGVAAKSKTRKRSKPAQG